MWFSYTLGFLKLVTSNNILSGFLIMTGQLLDAVATPIAGYILDRTHNKKKWHFIGSLATCGSFPIIFTVCTLCNQDSTWEGLYRGVFISVFQISWAFVQISHLSILPQLSKNTKEKSELTAYRYAASMIANIILYLITLYCFYGTATGETTLFSATDNQRFFEIAVSITAIGLLSSTAFHLIIKTREPAIERSETEKVVSCSATLGDIFKVAAIYTSSRLYINATIEYMVLYLNETVLSNKETIATIPLTMFALSALTSLFFKHVIRVNNQKITFLIGWIFCMAGCLTILMRNGRSDDVVDLFIASALFGTGGALTLVVSLSFAANMATTEGKEGFIFSTVTFADKAMNGIAVLSIEYLKCEDPLLCESYYKNVMVFFNGCVITVGLMFVYFMPLHITQFNCITRI
ncbi:hypothetical protein GE061_001179 [Apolygus lucorum]|uniref:Major facilitator superfamily associated domain-containing protein n=1 Tax=Apolygus lucorum TaxID=248454 RepID=A0A6A4KE55_APOLU|nr:hypothetical protein GE061_001179 [Apolygus lucorum]